MTRYTLLITILLLATNAPAQETVDQAALQQLVKACEESHSTGLSIWVDGKPYKNYNFGHDTQQVAAYSAAKSLISLTIGKLITDYKLASIDTPVWRFYPEWKQGLKKTITIRHLLNHTSALEYHDDDPDGWETPDVIKYALSASLTDTPGHSFWYNDNAVHLLHGIIQKITGMPMDRYITASIFKPMGIVDYSWSHDKAGNPEGLNIAPAELVKIGQLVLNKGKWNGKQLVDAQWLDASLAQGQPFVPNCGLLWWRIPDKIIYTVDDTLLTAFKMAGVNEQFIAKFAQLKGSYENENIPVSKLVAVFGADWLAVLNKELYPYFPTRSRWHLSSNYIGYKAEGWLGQYVIIYPGKNIVACRMIKQGDTNSNTEMRDFEKYVYRLRD